VTAGKVRPGAARGGALLLALAGVLQAQSPGSSACRPTIAPRGGGPQVADTLFDPPLLRPAFPSGQGPVVLLDESHHNFHTAGGRYAPFARLLRRDGFVVRPGREPLDPAALRGVGVLVIANALSAERSRGPWSLPNPPAFAPGEIGIIRDWVAGGGSLLLIADHMPFPGAAETLALAFGMAFTDGFATDSSCARDEFLFTRADATLGDHPIVRGRNPGERVDSVRSFTGQAFRIPPEAVSLLRVPAGTVVLLPVTAWRFSDSTPRIAADGMSQGAVRRFGRGRVAVFGEAAMFSAQVSGPERRPMGMNDPGAGRNPQFLLNVMHWLAGLLSRP
jgi:hypothetical protein